MLVTYQVCPNVVLSAAFSASKNGRISELAATSRNS